MNVYPQERDEAQRGLLKKETEKRLAAEAAAEKEHTCSATKMI